MTLRRTRWLKIPLLLGGVPLFAGVAVFLLWIVTEWNWLTTAGVWTLSAGLISVLAGLLYLGLGILNRVRAGDWPGAYVGPTVFVGMILAINIPVAACLVWAAVQLTTSYRVIVRNHASSPIQQARLTGAGVSLGIVRIEPGSSVTKRFHIPEDGVLRFSAELSGRKVSAVVDPYVTHSLGGKKEIDIYTDGAIQVRSKPK